MKLTWIKLCLICLTFLHCDGVSDDHNLQAFYFGAFDNQPLDKSRNHTVDYPLELAEDTIAETPMKKEPDSRTSHAKSIKNAVQRFHFRNWPFQSGHPYSPVVETTGQARSKSKMNNVHFRSDDRNRVDYKVHVSPRRRPRSISKCHANASCHKAVKRSRRLPDRAFVFRQMGDEEETTVCTPQCEGMMHLLTFPPAPECCAESKSFRLQPPRDRHRELNEAVKCGYMTKQALAFESSRPTQPESDHGKGCPASFRPRNLLNSELSAMLDVRRRRSANWALSVKNAIVDTGRLMAKKGGKFRLSDVLGKYRNSDNATNINGVKKNGSTKPCTVPHSGHQCHYHYKNREERRRHYFSSTKTKHRRVMTTPCAEKATLMGVAAKAVSSSSKSVVTSSSEAKNVTTS